MKTIIALIALAFSTFGYCQDTQATEKKAPTAFKQITPEAKFKNDVERDSFTIYTVGGLKPYNHEETQAFEKKYNVTYHDFGCLAPGNMDFHSAYNRLVFQHFRTKWGNEWQKEIKDNAIGLYHWNQEK